MAFHNSWEWPDEELEAVEAGVNMINDFCNNEVIKIVEDQREITTGNPTRIVRNPNKMSVIQLYFAVGGLVLGLYDETTKDLTLYTVAFQMAADDDSDEAYLRIMKSTAAHEILHAMGMPHVSPEYDEKSLMNAYSEEGQRLGVAERTGLQTLGYDCR